MRKNWIWLSRDMDLPSVFAIINGILFHITWFCQYVTNSDAVVLANSSICKQLEAKEINFPPLKHLNNCLLDSCLTTEWEIKYFLSKSGLCDPNLVNLLIDCHVPEESLGVGSFFFLIGIHSMQGGTATTWHGVTKKEAEKIKT